MGCRIFAGVQFMSRHIVADPRVCHGKPTFRGTRILVSDVLDQVASGMAWESIIEEWNGSITQEAIKEAVQLASQALLSLLAADRHAWGYRSISVSGLFLA